MSLGMLKVIEICAIEVAFLTPRRAICDEILI